MGLLSESPEALGPDAREHASVMRYAPAFHKEPESKVWTLSSGVQVVPVRHGRNLIRWTWKCDNVECWEPHWGVEPGGCCSARCLLLSQFVPEQGDVPMDDEEPYEGVMERTADPEPSRATSSGENQVSEEAEGVVETPQPMDEASELK